MQPVALGVWQETVMGYAMNSWKDVGGCNVWLRTNNMAPGMRDVWKNSETRNIIWSPTAHWSYEGILDWFTYGVPQVRAKAKAAPNAKGRSCWKGKGKGKGKGRGRSESCSKGKGKGRICS